MNKVLCSFATDKYIGLSGDTSIYRELNAAIHISRDSIHAHYTITQETEEGSTKLETLKDTIDSFDVLYLMKENQWVAIDSSKIMLYRN